MSRRIFIVIATILTALGIASLGYYQFNQPTKLTISVGPAGGEDAKLIEAIAARLQSRREPIQLKVVPKGDSGESTDALDSGATDLAVIRSDSARPPNAGVIATLHKDPVMILAKRGGTIKKIIDLKGKKIGVLRLNPDSTATVSHNSELLKTILAYYSIQDTAIVPLAVSDVAKAFEEKRIDAIFSVLPLGGAAAGRVVEAAAQGDPLGPLFVPISEPEAIVLKYPRLVKDEIVRGAFGGQPAKPAAAVPTISVTHSIAANNSLGDTTVADLTRMIFKMRSYLARENKLAARLEAPPTDKDAAIPLHSGAAAYFDDEEQSFFDRFGDYFYIGSMMLGVLASAAAALISRLSSTARLSALEHVESAILLIEELRKGNTSEAIDKIEAQADLLVSNVVRGAVKSNLTDTDIASFQVAIDHVREGLREKRAEIWRRKADVREYGAEDPTLHELDNVQDFVQRGPRR